jgi:hypothetical protein
VAPTWTQSFHCHKNKQSCPKMERKLQDSENKHTYYLELNKKETKQDCADENNSIVVDSFCFRIWFYES